jgi:HD-like signal output (HDOD) protein
MQRQRTNAVAAAWILAAGLIGLVGNVTSVGAAVMVLGFGLVPPIVMMLRWSDPRQTPSGRP